MLARSSWVPEGDKPWYIIAATVPKTILLTPFLVSMGHWVEVLEPAPIRDEIATWVGKMWLHYASDKAAQ